MNKVKSRKFKWRYALFGVLTFYILLCQSCMTMRMSSEETANYFDTSKVSYASKTEIVGEHKIHFIQTGNSDKPTLFFVHGSPGSWDAYKQYLSDSLLVKKYRMIAIDRPGFGNSNFGNAEDLATQAQVIEDFITQIDNQLPLVLIGHSLGGPVIVKMATDHPNRFPNLVVLAGSIDPKAETPELWRKVLLSKPLRYLIPGALRPSNDELWWLKKDLYDMEPNLKNITSNVTIIHGTKDQLVPYKNMSYMNRKLVNAKSIDNISIENANHFIPWEHYDLIRNTLLRLSI